MRGMIVSRLSRRVLFAATASVAFAVALGSSPSKAGDQDSGQAEWPQSYEASPHMAVGREATPILSSATVDATEAAIQKYQDIVARGGWNQVPTGAELRVGSKSKAVEALRERLVASGDLDPVAGMGPVFEFVRRSGGQALPGPERPEPDRGRQRGHFHRAQRARRGAPATASDQYRSAQGL